MLDLGFSDRQTNSSILGLKGTLYVNHRYLEPFKFQANMLFQNEFNSIYIIRKNSKGIFSPSIWTKF